jgi:hypothetical protein
MCDAVPLGKRFPTYSGSIVPLSSRVKVAMKKILIGLLDQTVHCHIPGDLSAQNTNIFGSIKYEYIKLIEGKSHSTNLCGRSVMLQICRHANEAAECVEVFLLCEATLRRSFVTFM